MEPATHGTQLGSEGPAVEVSDTGPAVSLVTDTKVLDEVLIGCDAHRDLGSEAERTDPCRLINMAETNLPD